MNAEFSFRDVNVDMSDIPSYASPTEAAIFVVEATNRLFNDLKKDIGLQELGLFESTGCFTSYIVEEGEAEAEDNSDAEENNEDNKSDKKSFFSKGKELGGKVINKGKELIDKIIELFKKAAAKAKGMFEFIMRKMSELTAKVTAAFGGKVTEKALMDALEKVGSVKFSSPDFENLKKFLKEGGFDKGADEKFVTLKNAINGTSGEDNKEITVANVRAYFEGKKTEHTITSSNTNDVKDIVDVISKFGSSNKFLKETYKKCDSFYSDQIKELEKLNKEEIDQDKLNDYRTKLAQGNAVYGAALSAYYNLIRTDAMVAIKIVTKGKLGKAKKEEKPEEKPAEGNEKEEKIGESATYTTEVENLFNWSF